MWVLTLNQYIDRIRTKTVSHLLYYCARQMTYDMFYQNISYNMSETDNASHLNYQYLDIRRILQTNLTDKHRFIAYVPSNKQWQTKINAVVFIGCYHDSY